jgi:16S rRNA (cytidine1402-2'-O)-methyltransferase
MAGRLLVVGTPIGNLDDLTARARDALEGADLVVAEDTRRTGRLLDRLGIHARLVSFFEGNERERVPELVERIRGGGNLALVSDAGMPAISDPGYRLVRACLDEGIDVRVVPGPSAGVAALAVSGLATDRFAFEGFAPRKRGERRARLQALSADPRTLVFFEAPGRVADLLGDMLDVLGDREAAVARELTKLHEEILRGRVAQLRDRLAERPARGEVVVVIAGAPEPPTPDLDELVRLAQDLVGGGMRARAAASTVAHDHGVSANEIYRLLHERR